MKKIILTILALFLFFINTVTDVEASQTSKEYKIAATDGFTLRAVLSYPKTKGQKEFKTVVLLHSLGYTSTWWGDLPAKLAEKGYAVLTIDLRGHGGSVYNKNLAKVSWKSMTKTAYAKYPSDVAEIIDYIKNENPKKSFFDDWAIIGCDIGASAGVMAADKLKYKPKTIVMLSPIVQTKGLYIPVSIAQLDSVDFLSITGKNDPVSKSAQNYLKKFAQAGFEEYECNANTTGILMIKSDPELTTVITEWVGSYLD